MRDETFQMLDRLGALRPDLVLTRTDAGIMAATPDSTRRCRLSREPFGWTVQDFTGTTGRPARQRGTLSIAQATTLADIWTVPA